ncbi:MAG: serine protease [Gammaproteobacteria bacterium]|nr:MAG: serine protease [Gammaproteobacteria bacterium]
MKAIPFNKNIVFSVVLAVITYAIVNRVIPPHVTPVFDVVISKNRSSITDVNQARDIELSKTVKIDLINLAEKSRFRHPKLGDIGYANDFFVDINAPFTVKRAGEYVFFLSSDDGFSFSVDGKQLCEFAKDRPLSTDTCRVNLTEGKHTFKLTYFQGGGMAGLTMSYAFASDGKQYLAGDDSKYISF